LFGEAAPPADAPASASELCGEIAGASGGQNPVAQKTLDWRPPFISTALSTVAPNLAKR